MIVRILTWIIIIIVLWYLLYTFYLHVFLCINVHDSIWKKYWSFREYRISNFKIKLKVFYLFFIQSFYWKIKKIKCILWWYFKVFMSLNFFILLSLDKYVICVQLVSLLIFIITGKYLNLNWDYTHAYKNLYKY